MIKKTLGLFRRSRLAAALLAASLPAMAMVQPVEAASVKNVVLVHGAWADGSSWSEVIPLLKKKGLNVVAVQLPLTSLQDDANTVKRAIALLDGPIVLVGHSYGGAVITEAGNDPKVTKLVYVAAFAPDAGQSAGSLSANAEKPPMADELKPDSQGFLKISEKGVYEDFAQDVPETRKAVLAAAEAPTNVKSLGGNISQAAWHDKPSWYIVATNDRAIPPTLERTMAKTIKATTTELPASHVAMISHPKEVVDVIVKAAESK